MPQLKSQSQNLLLLYFLTGILLSFASTAEAHSDPWGDIHPRVQVMDGKFAIVFNTSQPQRESDSQEAQPLQRMIFTSDGKLFAPRHPLKLKRSHEEFGPISLYGRGIRLGESTLIFQRNQSGYLLKSPDGKIMRVTLPWPKELEPELIDDVSVVAKGIAMTGNNMDPTTGSGGPLKFYWFEHESTDGPIVLTIGPTACIYHFPVISNIVWAGGKFWVAYMRPAEEGGMKLALWSWKPGEKEGKIEDLNSPADWNSTLSMAAIGNQLCLAYHCVADHDYPGIAKIETVFRKAR